MSGQAKAEILSKLQSEILLLQGFKPASLSSINPELGPILQAFPNANFPTGCIHEFLAPQLESIAATGGFISALLSTLMGDAGVVLWISHKKILFPPSLSNYGLKPHQVLTIEVQRQKDVMWVMEESLKCPALTAVIGEVAQLDFTASRRLQLAVEQSNVTGFVLQTTQKKVNTTACVARWSIEPAISESVGDLPGVGFPKWKVELHKVRNGRAGIWHVHWANSRFQVTTLPVGKSESINLDTSQLKVG